MRDAPHDHQQLCFVFNNFNHEEWLREQLFVPITVLVIGMIVETIGHAFFVYEHPNAIIAGEVVRGGGFVLACLVLFNLATVLNAYANAMPKPQKSWAIQHAKAVRDWGVLAASCYPVSVMVAVLAGTIISKESSFVSAMCLTLCLLLNIAVIATATVWSWVLFVRTRNDAMRLVAESSNV